MAKTTGKDEQRPIIIIKKVKKVEGGHHGGAWKVAYADFVTAMMAFFLLLWLLNVVTAEALSTISNYFDPSHPRLAEMTSGAGGIMGGTSTSPDGAQTTDVQPLTQTDPSGMAGKGQQEPSDRVDHMYQEEKSQLAQLEEELRRQEEDRFEEAKREMEEELRSNPDLAELSKNMMVDITSEGLRIQIVDQDGRPMFPLGKAEMFDYTKKLIGMVAERVKDMPNDISIRGHTDGYKYPAGATYTNWELSADRANASRRELVTAGISAAKIANVMGKADHDHLVPDKPLDAQNRRITIIMMREDVEKAIERGAFGKALQTRKKTVNTPIRQPETFRKTPGTVYFP